MLKNVRLHLEKDEQVQQELDEKLASQVLELSHINSEAFRRNIPSINDLLAGFELTNIGVFMNKHQHVNIVDYSLGRTLYGFNPEQEVSRQVNFFGEYPVYVPIKPPYISSADENSETWCSESPLNSLKSHTKKSKSIDVLVMLGLGLGIHIRHLLADFQIRHLIIYEPEVQYLKCSTLCENWQRIFKLAQKHKTAIYFQVGKDARNIVADLTELSAVSEFDGFHLYKHYSHPVFDSLYKQSLTSDWSQISSSGFQFQDEYSRDAFCPRWPGVPQPDNYRALLSSRLEKNLSAFKTYYPDIYKAFKHYEPSHWRPVAEKDGSVNMYNQDVNCTWYFDEPKVECLKNFEFYSEQPNKDGLALGYKGEKLKHYVHYQFVKKTEDTLEKVKEEVGALPDTIKSMIMFGIGSGYQLETLFERHDVEALFLCEPNRDFFYASLYAIDWEQILTKIDEKGWRLYINIGDDGTHLFRDLLNQFYSIGPYILASTYFYQAYYNASLNAAIAQLREQLYVVILMGEYYDHAKFGIAHTVAGIKNRFPHLVKHPSRKLSDDAKDVPVILVGNGPSLDYSLEALKACQEQAIVVSCGTSLQVLQRNNIIPDFHAEIEQNRSTFDWISRIGAPDYLKKLTLLSANGVHPDTAKLFGSTLISFKEGESSTVSALEVLGSDNYATLQFAFPTVSNFALNLFCQLGFREVYLIGVDLGFVNDSQHHSTQSGYYDTSGKQLYEYKDKNNTTIRVPGNFRDTVFTKDEFKVAKMVMEQSLGRFHIDCYNTSDGAKIQGTVPLNIDDILVVSSPAQKQACIDAIKNRAYSSAGLTDFKSKFYQKFEQDRLHNELSVFVQHVEENVTTRAQAQRQIDKFKELLFASYQHGKSLLFYLLYGTTNYANAVLSKTLFASAEFNAELYNEVRQEWLACLENIRTQLKSGMESVDVSSSLVESRINQLINQTLREKEVLIFSDSPSLPFCIDFYEKRFDTGLNVQINSVTCDIQNSIVNSGNAAQIILFTGSHTVDVLRRKLSELQLAFAQAQIIVVIDGNDVELLQLKSLDNVSCYVSPGDYRNSSFPVQSNDWYRLSDCLRNLDAFLHFDVIFPKITRVEGEDNGFTFGYEQFSEWYQFDLGSLIGLSPHHIDTTELVLSNGIRPAFTHKGIDIADQTKNVWAKDKLDSFISELTKFFQE